MNGHEFEQASGGGDGLGSLACYSPWGRKELDMTERLNNNNIYLGFPGSASGKEPACQCRVDLRDVGLIPGSGRSAGGGHGNPLQYSGLENPMDRGAWWAEVHGVA